MNGSAAEIAALRQRTVEAETAMEGKQVCWASTPSSVPALRRKGVLFSGTLGNRRYYGFASGHDQEQFVYDRHDTIFTVSRDIRAVLGLSPPVFAGTYMSRTPAPAAPLPKARRRVPSTPVAPVAAPAAPAETVAAAPPPAKVNRFRK